jgi:hypothetical protein
MKTAEEWLNDKQFCQRTSPNTGNFTVYGIEAIQQDVLSAGRVMKVASKDGLVTVGQLKAALRKVPDNYEVVGSVMNCAANIRAVVVHMNEPLVCLYDADKRRKQA